MKMKITRSTTGVTYVTKKCADGISGPLSKAHNLSWDWKFGWKMSESSKRVWGARKRFWSSQIWHLGSKTILFNLTISKERSSRLKINKSSSKFQEPKSSSMRAWSYMLANPRPNTWKFLQSNIGKTLGYSKSKSTISIPRISKSCLSNSSITNGSHWSMTMSSTKRSTKMGSKNLRSISRRIITSTNGVRSNMTPVVKFSWFGPHSAEISQNMVLKSGSRILSNWWQMKVDIYRWTL